MYLSKNKLMKPAILLPGQKMILLFSERNVNPPQKIIRSLFQLNYDDH